MTDKENLNATRPTAAAVDSRVPASGLTRRVETVGRVGRSGGPVGRGRLYHYDRLEGVKNATLKAEADQADRMPDDEARRTLNALHSLFGVDNLPEGLIYDFDHAMFICYALNGGSTLSPSDRVTFRLIRDGQASSFDWMQVTKHLKDNLRRFFRTFADDVIAACKHLYYSYDIHDVEQVVMRDRLVALATARNLVRFPYLVADCCDAATVLSSTELSSVLASKAAVVGATYNAVDRQKPMQAIQSLEGYDSTNGVNMPVVESRGIYRD